MKVSVQSGNVVLAPGGVSKSVVATLGGGSDVTEPISQPAGIVGGALTDADLAAIEQEVNAAGGFSTLNTGDTLSGVVEITTDDDKYALIRVPAPYCEIGKDSALMLLGPGRSMAIEQKKARSLVVGLVAELPVNAA